MTVEQLIKKLNKFPPSTIVTISNDDFYVSGEYVAKTILYSESDNTVEICTDYKKRLGD